MVPTATFFTLLRNYNPVNELIAPQIKQIFGNYGPEVLNTFKAHWDARTSNKPVQRLADFFAKLDGQLKNIDDPGIVEGWRAHFKAQPPLVKSETFKLLPNPVFLGKNMPKLGPVDPRNLFQAATTPFFNTAGGGGAPPNYTNIGVRLSPTLEANIASALKIVGTVSNKNLTPIIGSLAKSTMNHGTNLVLDSEHVKRVGEVITSYTKQLQSVVGDASSFLLKSLNFNKFGVQNVDISSPAIAFTNIVEGLNTVVDGIGKDLVANLPINVKDFASPKSSNLV